MKRVGWWTATFAYVGCGWVAISASRGAERPTTVAVAVAASFLPYAALVFMLGRKARSPVHDGASSSPRAWVRPLLLSVCLGVMLVGVPPVLSDDLYRYVWDGRVFAAGYDPYAHPPASAALAELRDESALRINHAELPTIYPPLAIAAFAMLSGLGVLGPKLLALLGHALLVVAVSRLTPPSRNEAASFAVAANPLLLAEGPLNGHIDVLAAACMLLALLAWSGLPGGGLRVAPGLGSLRRHRLRADRVARRWVCLFGALAIGLKLVGFLLLPLMACARDRALRRLTPVLGLVGIALLVPLFVAGHAGRDVPSGLGQYATRWRGNDGVYGVLEWGIERALVQHYGTRWGKLNLEPEPAWLRGLSRVGLDPRSGLLRPKKEPPPRALLEPAVLARPLARASVAGLLWLVVASVIIRRVPPPLALRHIVLAALLLAPQLHPWYLALLVPLEFITGRVAGLAFSAGVYVAYVPLDGWVILRVWETDSLALGLMHLLVLGIVVVEWVRAREAVSEPERCQR